jgi:hypothetical protein
MQMIWGVDSKGGKIPLDPLAAVYKVEEGDKGGVFVIRDKNYMVNHFATCPAVRAGSRKGG